MEVTTTVRARVEENSIIAQVCPNPGAAVKPKQCRGQETAEQSPIFAAEMLLLILKSERSFKIREVLWVSDSGFGLGALRCSHIAFLLKTMTFISGWHSGTVVDLREEMRLPVARR